MTLSNELAPSAFHTYHEVKVMHSYSQEIKDWFFRNSENVRLEVAASAGTPATADVSSLTVLSIPKDTEISGIHLRSILLVQIRRTQEGILAETWLEGVYEYGTGQDDTQAIIDLVISLDEYLRVLNRKKKQLGASARKELDALRKLVGRERQKPATPGG
jgi:hypothetical protein